MSEEIKPELYPDSALGDNNIILSESPSLTYSTQLLQDAIDNTTKRLDDKEINIIEDFTSIFPLSVSLTLLVVILIFIYISFF